MALILLTMWHSLRSYNWLGSSHNVIWEREREKDVGVGGEGRKENGWMRQLTLTCLSILSRWNESFSLSNVKKKKKYPTPHLHNQDIFKQVSLFWKAHLTVFLWFNIQIMEPQMKGSRTLEVAVCDERDWIWAQIILLWELKDFSKHH